MKNVIKCRFPSFSRVVVFLFFFFGYTRNIFSYVRIERREVKKNNKKIERKTMKLFHVCWSFSSCLFSLKDYFFLPLFSHPSIYHRQKKQEGKGKFFQPWPHFTIISQVGKFQKTTSTRRHLSNNKTTVKRGRSLMSRDDG